MQVKYIKKRTGNIRISFFVSRGCKEQAFLHAIKPSYQNRIILDNRNTNLFSHECCNFVHGKKDIRYRLYTFLYLIFVCDKSKQHTPICPVINPHIYKFILVKGLIHRVTSIACSGTTAVHVCSWPSRQEWSCHLRNANLQRMFAFH